MHGHAADGAAGIRVVVREGVEAEPDGRRLLRRDSPRIIRTRAVRAIEGHRAVRERHLTPARADEEPAACGLGEVRANRAHHDGRGRARHAYESQPNRYVSESRYSPAARRGIAGNLALRNQSGALITNAATAVVGLVIDDTTLADGNRARDDACLSQPTADERASILRDLSRSAPVKDACTLLGIVVDDGAPKDSECRRGRARLESIFPGDGYVLKVIVSALWR